MGKYVLAQYNYTNPPQGFAVVDLGTMNWTHEARHLYSAGIPSPRAKGTSYQVVGNLVCTHYDNVSRYDTYHDVKGVAINESDGRVYIYDERFADHSVPTPDIKAALNGVKLLYERNDNTIPYTSVPCSYYALYHNVNLWDEQWEIGTISGQTGEKVNATTTIRSKNFIECLPSTQYYVNKSDVRLFYYDADKNYINWTTTSSVFNTPANAYYLLFRMDASYGTTYNHDITIYKSTTSADARNTNQYLLEVLIK